MRLFQIAVFLGWALSGQAQESFTWSRTAVALAEGGMVEAFALQTATHRLIFSPPKGSRVEVVEKRKVLVFWHNQGGGATLEITTNSPGALPKEDVLKNRVLQDYPGAAILQSAACYAGSGPGWMIDVLRVLPSEARLRTRLVFLPFSGGTVELAFGSENKIFEQQRYLMGNLLNSLHVEALAPSQR